MLGQATPFASSSEASSSSSPVPPLPSSSPSSSSSAASCSRRRDGQKTCPPRRFLRRRVAATTFLSVLAASTALIAQPTEAQNFTFPSLDYDSLGAIGVAGSFAGLDLWSESTSSLNPSNTFDSSSSTILQISSNGTITQLNATQSGGVVNAMCAPTTNGTLIYAAGNFTKMGSVSAANIASYNTATDTWAALASGLDGEVESLLCLDSILLAAGSFTAPTGATRSEYKGAVAGWNYTTKAWTSLDFGGLNGTVMTMMPGINASNVRFGGSFSTEFSNSSNVSTSGTNTSASALTAKMAPISLAMSLFEGGPASSNSSFDMATQILCPQGADGAGNTYLWEDEQTGDLRISLFHRVWARAFRLGNTFHEGKGVRNFSITSLPDNTVLELLYLDPETQKNVTCTTECPLHHDSAVPYQDFLITNATSNGSYNGTKVLSGFVITVNSYYGTGAGLHILELLSDGGWANAYESYNRGACDSPVDGVNGTGSGTRREGSDWYHTQLTSNWGGVPYGVYQLTDSWSNLDNYSDYQVAWDVDLAVRGNYSVYLHVPGCSLSDQCDQRTDVQIIIFPNSTSSTDEYVVSQNVTDDSSILIWEGSVDATSDTFMPSVTLSIPSDGTEPSSDTFTIVADQVRFVLRDSVDIPQSMSSGVVEKGVGVFEYDVLDVYQRDSVVTATAVVNETRLTEFSAFGATLLNDGFNVSAGEYVSSIASAANYTFIGGKFASADFSTSGSGSGFKNIVAYNSLLTWNYTANETSGVAYTRLSGGGVNGTVSSLVTIDNYLFVGGAFTGLGDESASLKYLARYNPKDGTWAALGNGPNGEVTSMAAYGTDGLLVSGDFTSVGSSTDAGGWGIWNTSTNQWLSQSGLLVGSISSVSVVNGTAYIIGSVAGVSGNAASGAAGLEPPASDATEPTIENLGFSFTSSSSTSDTASDITRAKIKSPKRSVQAKKRSGATKSAKRAYGASGSRRSQSRPSFIQRIARSIFGGSSKTVAKGVQARASTSSSTEPAALLTNGTNEVFASAFWETSDDVYMTILGGNFTTTSGINNLALYNPSSSTLYAFPTYASTSNSTNKPTVFRALAVVGDLLFAGGDGGLLCYNLTTNEWNTALSTLQASTGTSLTVTAIAHRPDTSTVIVAGNFSGPGELPCENICSWDITGEKWSPLGGGINGSIVALDFAGSKAASVIVAGTFNLNGSTTPLATYDLTSTTSSWSSLGVVGTGAGEADGPATAVSVDNLNADAIFVAGRNTEGTAPWISKWEGSSYTPLNSSELGDDSGIAQLTFVPLTKAHSSNSILENNRLLVASGTLTLTSYGNVSSAFFDGETWTPFLVSTSTSGTAGSLRAFSRSNEVLTFMNLHVLAIGLVILISIAIGLGIVFLLVLIGLLVALARRRPNRGVEVPISPSDELLASDKKRPSSLLATLNAATENVMGAGAGAAAGAAATTAYTSSSGHHRRDTSAGMTDVYGPSSSGHHRRDTSAGMTDAYGPTSSGHDTSDPSSHYHSEAMTGQSNYYTDSSQGHGRSFGAAAAAAAGTSTGMETSTTTDDEEGIEAHMRFSFEATHPSELGVRAGDNITVLDDADEHWWLARAEDGRVGVVPASYVL